ncbi:MAG: HIT family protein [Bacteroidaceae bacterium]
MKNCRFCDIANENIKRSEDAIFLKNDEFFAISSIGALVEGWTLIVPRKHCCSMKDIYGSKRFVEFANEIAKALKACYGPIVAFEHGPNREGSDTSCGTDHAHIHFVPYHSLAKQLDHIGMNWKTCRADEIKDIVGNSEYLFYVEVGGKWEKSIGRVHILEKPISQFFRKVIADDMGISEKYSYKTNPDTDLTLKTIARMTSYFVENNGGNDVE